MRIIESALEMQQTALVLRAQGERIGFVPTMGNLHAGHLSLIRIARQQAGTAVVSIFVNPTQFGPNEDYAAYPRTFAADRAACERAGVDLVFHPAVTEMYPEGASVSVTENALSRTLCGASRPGHFDGVCTIVAKLFHLIQPHVAVFGEKDAQQLRIIRRMVRDLRMPVEIVAGPTVREPDGLALSSRNQYLDADQRRQAACLHLALEECRRRFAAGMRDPRELAAAMRALIARHPAARPDYIEIVDNETLAPLTGPIVRPALAALAVRVGAPRLIDNTVLTP
ncbi:MAG: pantoate--beta-alanine ligase [Kiritimatiellae bacterium]|mgnify:CR=1 FL=1|jgi:pantoate--beta-alanine ligase|nr:pantoate--beta-alanine ligase [Kiritimatiellia bacterium]NLD90239.1 pantoate--beta-alanine ligase [Lentisphaerota bacterium]HPC19054.1 pantoate--beta-alanine ligase [Kiritimatiellia bacterium]HQN79759.1 pantoate--beta-alanine ligase [Kiritimatiellia bacterium]HQQ61058.1 pantoate--beta-alanine ligase [Kiritimatiellia bacterium]